MEIALTKGAVTLIDDEAYSVISRWKWKLHPQGYAARSTIIERRYRTILMHRSLSNCPDGMEVDHINGNKLDNRSCNLRLIDPIAHRHLHEHIIVAHQKASQQLPDTKPCVSCGTIFQVNPRKRRRHKCCSAACASRMRTEGQRRARLARQTR